MATYASIIQTCNIPHKRLINLFIFILISLKCHLTEDPYQRRCWLTIKNYRFPHVSKIGKRHLDDCKDYCDRIIPFCRMVVFHYHDKSKTECFINDQIRPLDYSLFESSRNIDTLLLDFDCSINLPSCWTVKGDFSFQDLQRVDEPNMSLEVCMVRCINDYPECNVISFVIIGQRGTECYVKTRAGSLDKFRAREGVTTYVLNRTCRITDDISGARELFNYSTMPRDVTIEISDLNGKSFFDKYYLYILVAGGGLLFLICAGFVAKLSKSTSSGFSSEDL